MFCGFPTPFYTSSPEKIFFHVEAKSQLEAIYIYMKKNKTGCNIFIMLQVECFFPTFCHLFSVAICHFFVNISVIILKILLCSFVETLFLRGPILKYGRYNSRLALAQKNIVSLPH